MRLGGNVFYQGTDPEEYALAHVLKGFGAALLPDWVTLENPAGVKAFKDAMKKPVKSAISAAGTVYRVFLIPAAPK